MLFDKDAFFEKMLPQLLAAVVGAVAAIGTHLWLKPQEYQIIKIFDDRREAAIRFAVGVACGLVFGGTAGLKIAAELGITGALGPGELMLMGSAAASLCAWWALGLIMRVLTKPRRN